MTAPEVVGLLVGAIAVVVVRWAADRWPSATERRRRDLENRILEKQLEDLEDEPDA